MKNKGEKITGAQWLLLVIITILVFFIPDIYLSIRQNYFSKSLRIYPLYEIKFNRIDQSYTDVEPKKTDIDEDEKALSTDKPKQGDDTEADQTNIDNTEAGDKEVKNTNNFNEKEISPQEIRVVQLIDAKPIHEQVFITNSEISIISEKKLSGYSKTGEKKWEADINAPEPYIINSKDYLFIINKQKGDIAKISSDNKILNVIQNMGKIGDIKAGADKIVFNTANTNEFVILDEELKIQAKFTIPYGNAVGFEISEDSKHIIVNIVNINNLALESFILTYNMNGKIVGTADIGNQLVYIMGLDENMIVITDENLISFDKNGLKSREISNNSSIIDVVSKSDKVYVLSFSTKNPENTEITIYSQYLDKLFSVELEDSKEGILASDKFCILYDYKTLALYDQRLNFISKYDIKTNINHIEWIDDYTFAIIGDGVVNTYEIR